ncbi:endonuclease V [candidate division WOR-3 bacterium]|nr:endonuclease V [candidate division WOR-3 bacterium]
MDCARLKSIQEKLRTRVSLKCFTGKMEFVAGFDCAFEKDMIIGAVVLMKYPECVTVEKKFDIRKAEFPYLPGFLSFREIPALIAAFRKLEIKPDLLIVDGQGILHPRFFGIACHLGVILNKPSIGCAKSRLCGEYEEPETKRGGKSPVILNGKTMGYALRTKDGVKPVLVSPGHMMTPLRAADIVLKLSSYRLPEPVRIADIFSKECKSIRHFL